MHKKLDFGNQNVADHIFKMHKFILKVHHTPWRWLKNNNDIIQYYNNIYNTIMILIDFFNLIVPIVKQYIFSCRYKSNANPNKHGLRNVIIETLMKNCRYKDYESQSQEIFDKL